MGLNSFITMSQERDSGLFPRIIRIRWIFYWFIMPRLTKLLFTGGKKHLFTGVKKIDLLLVNLFCLTLLLTKGTHCLLLHGWLDNAGTWDKVGYSYKQATRRSSSMDGTPPNKYYHIYFIFSIYHILHRWCPSSTLSSTWWLSTCLAMASLLISPPVISFSKGAFIKYLFFLGRPSLS